MKEVEFELQDEELQRGVEELSAEEEEALAHVLRLAAANFLAGKSMAFEEEKRVKERQAALRESWGL